MNTETLKQKSLKLRLIIDSLKAQVPAAMKLSVELEPLLKAVDQERIRTPMEWRDIPGHYLFTEEGLLFALATVVHTHPGAERSTGSPVGETSSSSSSRNSASSTRASTAA